MRRGLLRRLEPRSTPTSTSWLPHHTRRRRSSSSNSSSRGVVPASPPAYACAPFSCARRGPTPVAWATLGQQGSPWQRRRRQDVPLPPASFQTRHLAAAPPSAEQHLDGGFSTERDFHLAADATLDRVQHLVDGLEDVVEDFEANLSMGVLNIIMGSHGTWVLNKQTPNRQVWWSSPLSGPLRFEYDPATQHWVSTRDKRELFALLAAEVYKVAGIDILEHEKK